MNPFSTCFTMPGKLPFLGQNRDDADQALQLWGANGFEGQVVGPHGSGKSTWVRWLSAGDGNTVPAPNRVLIRFHFVTIQSARRVRNRSQSVACFDRRRFGSVQRVPSAVLVVDGIERVSLFQRLALLRHFRNRKFGILLTTHRRMDGIQTLLELEPDPEMLSRLVELLAPDVAGREEFSDARLREIFTEETGNLRECLMRCYDVYEKSGLDGGRRNSEQSVRLRSDSQHDERRSNHDADGES